MLWGWRGPTANDTHKSLGPNGNNTREKTPSMTSLRCVYHTHTSTFQHSQGSYKFFCFRRNKVIQKNNAEVLTILQCSYVPWLQRFLCRWGGTSFLWAPVFHPESPRHTGHRASLQYSTHISTSSRLQDKHGHSYVLIPDVLRCSQCFLGERVYNTSSSIWRKWRAHFCLLTPSNWNHTEKNFWVIQFCPFSHVM